MDRKDILHAAVSVTGAKLGSDYDRLMSARLGLFGDEISAHISDSDRAGIFVPLELVEAGKDLPGCALTLQDRAVFAWSNGKTWRPKQFEEVVSYSSIKNVEPGTRSETPTSTLRVSADRDWTFAHYNFAGGVPALLIGILKRTETFDSLVALLRDGSSSDAPT